MFYVIILATLLYVAFIAVHLRRLQERTEREYADQLKQMNELYFRLAEQRDKLIKDKVDAEGEAIRVFTLYEMTKEITRTLNEQDAFMIFRNKLNDHIQFDDCRYLPVPSEDIDRFKESEEHFVFDLINENRHIGSVSIKGLLAEDEEKAIILCHQFALALRRVKLYQKIERTAITDSLTELYTRGYTLRRLEEELERSRSRKIYMSLLMIDVDHFKNCNDTYGHLVGDHILRVMGSIIKESIREIDIPGRYGGEEFCVVLPDTDLVGASQVAERIRETCEKRVIKAYDASLSVTVSIGIAVYPKDAKRSGELIDKADWTLYKAKKQGRNRVCIFGE